jgi:hypothetical protein
LIKAGHPVIPIHPNVVKALQKCFEVYLREEGEGIR